MIRVEMKERKFTGGRSEVKLFAFEGPEAVGELFVNFGNAKIKRQPAASIYWIGVDEAHRGKGIATRLYEAAQALACSRGRVLASDVTLKEGSRGFWEKQRAKGRATKHQEKVAGKRMYRYALSCPATSLNPRWPSRHPQKDSDPPLAEADALAAQLVREFNLEWFLVGRGYGLGSDTPKNSIMLKALKVRHADQGKGIGTKVLQRFNEFADEHGTTLMLEAAVTDPWEPGSMGGTKSTKALMRLYRRLGFEAFRRSRIMVRHPKTPKRLNPTPSRDEMFRRVAEEHFDRFLAWVEKTPPGVVRREAFGVSGGRESGYAFELPGLSPKTYLVLTTKGRRGVAGSYSSQAMTRNNEKVRFIRINLLDRSDRLPDDLAERLQKARDTFIHEFVHLLDSERIPADAWLQASKVDTGGASYFRSPLEWNAYFQEGWANVDNFMRKLPASQFEDVIEDGWEGLRSRFSSLWHPEFIRTIRKSPKLWKKFLSRARQSWDHSLPAWIDARPKRRADEPDEVEEEAYRVGIVIDDDPQAAMSYLMSFVQKRRGISARAAADLVFKWEENGWL